MGSSCIVIFPCYPSAGYTVRLLETAALMLKKKRCRNGVTCVAFVCQSVKGLSNCTYLRIRLEQNQSQHIATHGHIMVK